MGTGGEEILPQNSNRVYLFVQNEDDTDFAKIAIGRRLTAITDPGIRLDANGGAFEQWRGVRAGGIGSSIGAPIFAVAAAGTVTLSIVAFERGADWITAKRARKAEGQRAAL